MTWQQIILSTCILIGFNLVNSRVDAYKIKVLNKMIRHGINLAAYLLCAGACILFLKIQLWPAATVYLVSAFFCRQIFFDIPLNLRRGLDWDYVSLDRPPKALMDRIEVRLFGYNGKAPTICYGILWAATFTLQFFI